MSDKIDVVKLLERFEIDAKPRGVELWAWCPFHSERTPSWQMRNEPGAPEHGLWRCYGCGVRGNVITLAAAMLGITNAEAFEWLQGSGLVENAVPLHVRVVTGPARTLRGFKLPKGVIFTPLEQWVTPAKRYAIERGITPEQVERYGIGYSVGGVLGCRIVFPIRDGAGRVVSYTGRTFAGESPRYKNPGEDEGADLGAVWGEELWPKPGERDLLVVTEGSINGLAVERAMPLCGFQATIGAACGSSLMPGAIARICSWPRVIVASDNDPAGDKMWKALQGGARWTRFARVEFPLKQDAQALPCDMLATLIDRAYAEIIRTTNGATTWHTD